MIETMLHSRPLKLFFDGSLESSYRHVTKFLECEEFCGHRDSPCSKCGIIRTEKGFWRLLKTSPFNKHEYARNPNSGRWLEYRGEVWEWVPVHEPSVFITIGSKEIIHTTIQLNEFAQFIRFVSTVGQPGEICWHERDERWFIHFPSVVEFREPISFVTDEQINFQVTEGKGETPTDKIWIIWIESIGNLFAHGAGGEICFHKKSNRWFIHF